ncbi:hypothetical protein [Pelomonas aquatica]|jgi:hypothetical protein|uniref:Uncharacterized protein n=1 Tax=Pelomonas aquatica TaxID=431058 RepID=A0A9X4R5A5_9BURK|nr:hypothetical protein [Pelomonas aquatica]MCY4756796.1 hypothetical protein [Pelomonas aquatica]MDG0864162.1 hypothetical protein [Pelomonas aquatica]
MSDSEPGAPAIAFVNLRDAPAADAQPRMEVHSWRSIRAPAGTLHLVTLRDLTEERGTVRVTSAITAVDKEAGIVTTSSGRQYALMRPAEEREFERDLLQGGAVRLGLGDAVDVSVLAWDQVEIG